MRDQPVHVATVNQQPIKSISLFALVMSILLVAVILRCWNINQSFWWDEIWSTMPYATASSLWQTISSLGYYFNNHLLYSLLARFSIMLLGENEIAARLPAVIMGLAGIAALFFTGKKFLGTGSGVLGALLLAVSAFISITLQKHGATRGLRCSLCSPHIIFSTACAPTGL